MNMPSKMSMAPTAKLAHDKGHTAAKVMIVDDESVSARLLQMFLEDVGYSDFVITNRSTEAMELLVNERPDVLLLDLQMPDVDGFEILTLIRAHPDMQHLPVLILTASEDAGCKLKALELGATDFLAKPVDTSELALRLRNTLAAKAYRDRLTFYDALTDMPNRRMFLDRFSDCLASAVRSGGAGAVLHIDLDRFSKLNDSLGHGAGDRLLRIIAKRIGRCVRETDEICRSPLNAGAASAARFGGDEFMVLLPSTNGSNNAAAVAKRILRAVSEPVSWEGGELIVTPSIGVLEFPTQARTVEALLRKVALATARAKLLGRNRFEMYSVQCETRSSVEVSFEADLHQALARDELRLHYQAKVDVATGQITGAEALLRWDSAVRGMVGPNQFIPLAEESGLILPFGAWVINTACQQLAQWAQAGWGHLHLAVNVASLQLKDGNLLDCVHNALQTSGVNPARLTLELTESAVIDNAEETIVTLNAIRELGVRLSLDDFGTGYSSLSYLERLPLDELKIDRSFVSRVSKHGDDAPILSAVIAMASSLGLQVVAEGVECEAQLDFLRSRGCDVFQGYWFAKPMPVDPFSVLLQEKQQGTGTA